MGQTFQRFGCRTEFSLYQSSHRSRPEPQRRFSEELPAGHQQFVFTVWVHVVHRLIISIVVRGLFFS
jgi:hypothetical protein